MNTILYPEWLVDGTGAPPRTGQALVFDDSGRITRVGWRVRRVAPNIFHPEFTRHPRGVHRGDVRWHEVQWFA